MLGAVPDDNGQIHACRSNDTGIVRMVDTESESCTSSETPINWSQFGGPIIHDANGQPLGNLLDTPAESQPLFKVYNAELKRVIDITYSSANNKYTVGSTEQTIQFASSDCTDQAYVADEPGVAATLDLHRTGNSTYGVVEDSTQPQNVTIGSYLQYDSATDQFSCQQQDPTFSDSFLTLTNVSLPFSTPIAEPLKF